MYLPKVKGKAWEVHENYKSSLPAAGIQLRLHDFIQDKTITKRNQHNKEIMMNVEARGGGGATIQSNQSDTLVYSYHSHTKVVSKLTWSTITKVCPLEVLMWSTGSITIRFLRITLYQTMLYEVPTAT